MGEKDERYTTENMKERNFRRGGTTYLMRYPGRREQQVQYLLGVYVMENSRYKKQEGIIFKSETGIVRGMSAGIMKKNINKRKNNRLSDKMA